jgi:hypothetical protein
VAAYLFSKVLVIRQKNILPASDFLDCQGCMKKTMDFLITRVTVCLSAINIVPLEHNPSFNTKEYIFII